MTRTVLPPGTVVASVFTPEQIAQLDAAEAELQRKAENDRYQIWEAGFLAGLASARGERPKNPYTWHGPTSAPVKP